MTAAQHARACTGRTTTTTVSLIFAAGEAPAPRLNGDEASRAVRERKPVGVGANTCTSARAFLFADRTASARTIFRTLSRSGGRSSLSRTLSLHHLSPRRPPSLPIPSQHPMPGSDHRVHIDTLTYTRDGLATAEPISLTVGAHNRIVLVRPDRVRLTTLSGFAYDSAFPGAPLAALLGCREAVAKLSSWHEGAVLQVLGHANVEDNLGHNKTLSQRRARVLLAILTADGESFEQLANEDGWGLAEHQALLRIVGFDPGPIDGDSGPMTRSAVLDFQRCANAGVLGLEPESLPESGDLDGDTVRALYRGFVVASSPSVPPEALHPTHAEVGCTEYNPVSKDPPVGHLNRRVSLAIHSQLPPYHDAAPCTEGDHAVCPVTEPQQDCMWYREHFIERLDPAAVFFDFQWFKLPEGGALLSVLTNLPADDVVEFQVWKDVGDFDGQVVAGHGPGRPPARGEAIGSPVEGTLRNGVCFARWSAPEDWNPYDVEDWFVDAEEGVGFRPPLFSVRHSQGWAFSRPPGVRLDRLIFSGKSPPGTLVMTNLGELVQVPDGVMRVPSMESVHVDEHVMVVGAALPDGWFEPVEEEE